jgi:hypothetical protein
MSIQRTWLCYIYNRYHKNQGQMYMSTQRAWFFDKNQGRMYMSIQRTWFFNMCTMDQYIPIYVFCGAFSKNDSEDGGNLMCTPVVYVIISFCHIYIYVYIFDCVFHFVHAVLLRPFFKKRFRGRG